MLFCDFLFKLVRSTKSLKKEKGSRNKAMQFANDSVRAELSRHKQQNAIVRVLEKCDLNRN
jgi:hypothetical protein